MSSFSTDLSKKLIEIERALCHSLRRGSGIEPVVKIRILPRSVPFRLRVYNLAGIKIEFRVYYCQTITNGTLHVYFV